MKKTVLFVLTGAVVILTCCTEIALDNRLAEGHVVVSPQWGSLAVPSSAACFFYPLSAGMAPVREGAADALLFRGSLPVGSYALLGWNTDAPGIEFGNLDDINLAEARMSGGVQPGELYSWHVDELVIAYRDTFFVHPSVLALIKTLTFRFRVSGSQNVDALECKLYGAYPSVLLLSGEPSPESSASAPGTSVVFTVPLSSASRAGDVSLEGSASVRLLGLLDPRNGLSYDNRLELTLHTPDASTRSGEVSMNGVLSEVLKANGDKLPSEVPVEITVDIRWLNSVLVASVTAWKNGEGGGQV